MIAMCELCTPADILTSNDLAYARFDSNGLSRGHTLIVPRRHVADYFDMTLQEQAAVGELLRAARDMIGARYTPDGFNIGVNVGKAAGQNRMHVHVHLIPRHTGDVADPSGGIRCVLPRG
jgi:diadenosine tetraphosphate (Ap4A) HIT family hydrolase